MISLTALQRKALKAQAHALNPVVMIGNDGVTENLVRETETALRAHGLIKVRMAGDDREARIAALEKLASELDAAPVQHIGKVLILYRPKPEEAQPKKTAQYKRRPSDVHQPKKRALLGA